MSITNENDFVSKSKMWIGKQHENRFFCSGDLCDIDAEINSISIQALSM